MEIGSHSTHDQLFVFASQRFNVFLSRSILLQFLQLFLYAFYAFYVRCDLFVGRQLIQCCSPEKEGWRE